MSSFSIQPSREEQVVVHLVSSLAPLLSGRSLDDCTSPADSTCKGGVAAAKAFVRYYTSSSSSSTQQPPTATQPYVFLAHLDKSSPFVQMTPLGWAVNRLVLGPELIGADAMLSQPSLLQQNKGDVGAVSQRDISQLQSQELPFLLSNAQIPLGNSWNPYSIPILFSETTTLAIMYIDGANQDLTSSQTETARGGLNYIARLNRENGCRVTLNDENERDRMAELFDSYVNRTIPSTEERTCWIPVILFADVKSKFDDLLETVINHEYPPGLLVDLEENSPPFGIPRQVETKFKTNKPTWLLSYEHKDDEYHHKVLTIEPAAGKIINLQLIHHDLLVNEKEDSNIPDSVELELVRDRIYNDTIVALAELAQEAMFNDPVVATSGGAMPVTRTGSYRRCKGGPCEIASLFLDAMVWYSGADVAFGNSGGFRGIGWPAGADIRISNIWDGLPFPNNLCEATVSGVSLFRIFNYSVSWATFEGENTEFGDRLLQVSSGMRLTYNTLLSGSRLIAMEVRDPATLELKPVERLKLYKIVTDSFMCTGFRPFSTFLSAEELVFPGEVPAVVDPGALVQDVVESFLVTEYQNKNRFYEPSAEGRMVNATLATNVLNLVQTQDSCTVNEFWNEQDFTCISCPNASGVIFVKESLEFQLSLGSSLDESVEETISFINTLTYPVSVVSRTVPFWVDVADKAAAFEAKPRVLWEDIRAGETVMLRVRPDITQLGPGMATGSVIFGVLDDFRFPGCTRPDASFHVQARVEPPEDLNQLGVVRIIGWVLSAIVVFLSLLLTIWVVRNRTSRIVTILQPIFLVMISLGVMVMGLALVPLGLDDEIVSVEVSSAACMAFPWLLSMGFTIAMSALFSKLWRINRLFNSARFRRMRVRETDVLGPFAVLFTINFAALTIWTCLDPLHFERREIDGSSHATYGACRPKDGTISLIMGLIDGVVNLSALAFASYQAYRARDISDEFSESKNVGIALFSWVQLFLIGVPVFFLIDEDNPSARYFISVGLTFAVSMSMLLIIYLPILVHKRKERQLAENNPSSHQSSRYAQRTSSRKIGASKESSFNSVGDTSGAGDTRTSHKASLGCGSSQFENEMDCTSKREETAVAIPPKHSLTNVEEEAEELVDEPRSNRNFSVLERTGDKVGALERQQVAP